MKQNTDLPLDRVAPAAASAIGSAFSDAMAKSGAEIRPTPSVPRYDSDGDFKGGKNINDKGNAYADMPLQTPFFVLNKGQAQDSSPNVSRTRSIDQINGDPNVDGLYIAFDQTKGHDQNNSLEWTKKLAYENVKAAITKSGEINSLDPRPDVIGQHLDSSNNVFSIAFHFKPKKR